MILKPHFAKFRMSEVSQFIKDVLSIVFKYPALQGEVAEESGILGSKGHELGKAHSAEQGSPLSLEIMALDGRRDRALTGIRQYTESLTNHFKDEISGAATIVLASIDKYGSKLTALNYEAETDVITNIVNSWDNDAKLKAAIATLNLGDWATELRGANATMNSKFLERVQESASAPQIKAVTLRKETINSYRELINNIVARATLSKTGEYAPLLNEFNELIGKYNTLVDARKGSEIEEAVGAQTQASAQK